MTPSPTQTTPFDIAEAFTTEPPLSISIRCPCCGAGHSKGGNPMYAYNCGSMPGGPSTPQCQRDRIPTPRTDNLPRRGAFNQHRVDDLIRHARQLERELHLATRDRDIAIARIEQADRQKADIVEAWKKEQMATYPARCKTCSYGQRDNTGDNPCPECKCPF